MAKQPDDNLEKFFLKRIKEYQIDFREEDWLKLSERLDAADVIKAGILKQKLIWIGSGALLVLSIVLLLWMSQNLTSQNTAGPSQPDKEEIADLKEKDQPTENDRSEVEKDSGAMISDKNTSSASDDVVSSNEFVDNERSNRERKTENTNMSEDEDLVENLLSGKDTESNPEILFSDDNDSNDEQHDDLHLSIQPMKGNISTQQMNGISFVQEKLISKGIEFKRNYSWNISVAADNSAVGVSNFDGPALRAGASVEYYLSSGFSVLAGVNYSIKKYTALGREYTPPYGFWTRGVVPNETLGECNVLDIPVNLSYYISNKKGQLYFLRAGLSSWLMLEEHYDYKYESNDPDLIRYWGGENENYHYFSIINISSGFEHPLNDKFSVLVEPYINIPLGGVGFGKVDLYSAGLKFSMKINHYKLNTSANKF